MNSKQVEQLNRAYNTWVQAENEANVYRSYDHYQTAFGQFGKAVAIEPNAYTFGLTARFCYFYAAFHNLKRKDSKSANQIYKVGADYANKALALDENEFNARFFKAISSIDLLGEKPSFSSLLLDTSQGGFFQRTIKGGFEHGRFSTAKTEFFKAVAALLDSFVAKSQEAFIEDVIQMIEDLQLIATAAIDYEFDLSNIFETIIDAPDYLSLKYYSSEEELDGLVNKYLNMQELASDRLQSMSILSK